MPAAVTTDSSRFTADADKEALSRVAMCAEAFEGGIGREFRERCEKFYRQYRSFDKLRSAWIPASPRSRSGPGCSTSRAANGGPRTSSTSGP
jgi:hypothetical protein